MFLLCIFVYFCVVGPRECSQLNENFSELGHAEWECETVCVGSGGKAAFDLKNKICKCALDNNTDDIEGNLILKEAELLGIPLVITKSITKRQVNGESALGQRAPQKINTPATLLRITTTRRPFRFTSNRPFAAAHRLTTPKININMQQRLQEIQKRINERRRSRARSRTGPQLQQRAGFPEETRPNLMERLRQMQKERQEKQRNRTAAPTTAAPNVAAAAPRSSGYSSPIVGISRNLTYDKSTEVEPNANGKNSNFELITQDPSLYDKNY